MRDRLKQGDSGTIGATRIGTRQASGDLGSERLSAGRAQDRRDIDPHAHAVTAPQHREAVTVRLRAVDNTTTSATRAEPTTDPRTACFSKEARPVRLTLVRQDPPAGRVPASIDQIRAMVARSRAEQGLPPTIEDSEVLERVAAIFKLAADPLPGFAVPKAA